jgi:hypothetical protein
VHLDISSSSSFLSKTEDLCCSFIFISKEHWLSSAVVLITSSQWVSSLSRKKTARESELAIVHFWVARWGWPVHRVHSQRTGEEGFTKRVVLPVCSHGFP